MNRTRTVLILSTDEKTGKSSVALVGLSKRSERLTLVSDIPEGEGLGIAESLRAQLGATLIGVAISPGIQLI